MPKGDRSRKVLSNAQRKYNWLLDIPTVVNPTKDTGYAEVWQTGDEGHPAEDMPKRPEGIPLDKAGIEILNDDEITEEMIAGEAVSHILNDRRNPNADSKIAEHYEKFVSSLTPQQEDRLLRRFFDEQARYNERRSFEDWKEMSGLPGEFRAYPFRQWDKENKGNYSKDFTSEQMRDLDEMMDYLRTKKK